jgi:uncharacterized protein (TIGR03118 family)
MRHFRNRTSTAMAALALAVAAIAGCSGDTVTNSTPGPGQTGSASSVQLGKFDQVALVSDGGGARFQDPALKNPWGVTTDPEGNVWVAVAGSNQVAAYTADGAREETITTHPSPVNGGSAAPIGLVYNPTVDFPIPSRSFSRLLIAGGGGTISAWDRELAGDAAVVIDETRKGAGFTGITIASDGGVNRLYAADFKLGTVDVYNGDFIYVRSFTDPSLPSGYAPFNVQNIDGALWVTYAMKGAGDVGTEMTGPGLGMVVVFSPRGAVLRRFAAGGPLNAPWGIAKAPAWMGSLAGMILVANFGDGRINVYDQAGAFAGQLQDRGGAPITIDGLWGIAFPQQEGSDRIYFTAGPGAERHGLLGYLTAGGV